MQMYPVETVRAGDKGLKASNAFGDTITIMMGLRICPRYGRASISTSCRESAHTACAAGIQNPSNVPSRTLAISPKVMAI